MFLKCINCMEKRVCTLCCLIRWKNELHQCLMAGINTGLAFTEGLLLEDEVQA